MSSGRSHTQAGVQRLAPPAEDGITATYEPSVRVQETHISTLFYSNGLVYKARKPVRFEFLDFTSRENREQDCHREVVLNRRLAPDVYLGVADLVMDGVPLDHVVVMRALPDEQKLSNLLRSGSHVDAYLDAIAETLASFHAKASRSPQVSASATPNAVRIKWMDNLAEMDRFASTIIDPVLEREIRWSIEQWLDTHSDLLIRRIAQGCICDGHGDLQASDIFCLDSGVRILDCLEFSDVLRYDDVCGDVAFLAMDLERLGHLESAQQFVRSYERHSGFSLPPALLDMHIAFRAYIRAKVSCLEAQQGSAKAGDAAQALQALARRHLLRTRQAVVLVGGLPGSGKSTLARALGCHIGWDVLSSDIVRREMSLGPTRYTRHAVEAVYAELFRRARALLREGRPVILDASWIRSGERTQAERLAEEMKAELIELQCTCPQSLGEGRIRARFARGNDASEASVAVREQLAEQMDPWPEAHLIDTATSPAQTLETAFAAMTTTGGPVPAGERPDNGTRGDPVHIELTQSEAGDLRDLLRGSLADLSSEIAGTDNAGYRKNLQDRRVSLEGVLARLEAG